MKPQNRTLKFLLGLVLLGVLALGVGLLSADEPYPIHETWKGDGSGHTISNPTIYVFWKWVMKVDLSGNIGGDYSIWWDESGYWGYIRGYKSTAHVDSVWGSGTYTIEYPSGMQGGTWGAVFDNVNDTCVGWWRHALCNNGTLEGTRTYHAD